MTQASRFQPNILLLQGEDLGCHLGCLGDPCARTPHLDRLAAEGALFTHAFSHAPVCAPSRGGMVTGRYAYSLGIHHMRSTLVRPPRCFTHELRDAGYFVAWPTKLDFNFEPLEGWRDSDQPWWDRPPPRAPFFVYENLPWTHESRMFEKVPKWHGPMALADGWQCDPADVPVPAYLPDIPELRLQLAAYYTALAATDARIGERLAWLDRYGLSESTIVVFLCDHGRGLPREKRWCYDAGVHVPLIIRWPGGPIAGNGVRVDELVGLVDVAPTLLSLAGVTPPASYQGRVFLGPQRSEPRPFVFGGRDRMDGNFDRVRYARDHRWHYIRNDAPRLPWAQRQAYMEQQPMVPVWRRMHARGELTGAETCFLGRSKPVEELYDSATDPGMVRNLAQDPAFHGELERLRQALATHLDEVGDLGGRSEEALVAEGLLVDRIPEYRAEHDRLLPEDQRLGPPFPPTTLEDARAGGWVDD